VVDLHTGSVRSIQWKEENNINTLPWPAQSPDLNIIENVWKVLKIQVQRRVNECAINLFYLTDLSKLLKQCSLGYGKG
jgi:transposase